MGRGPRGFAGHRSRGHPGLGPAWARVGLSTGRGLRAPRRPRGSQVPPLHPEHPAAFRGAVSGRLRSRSPPVHCPPWTGRSVSISRWWAARYRRWAGDVPVGAPPPHPRELAPAGPRGLGWSWRGTELPSRESLCPARMTPLTSAPQVQPQVGGQGHCHRETPPERLRPPGWASKARVGESGRKRGPEPLTGQSGEPPSRSGLGPEPTPHEHPAPLCLQPPPSRIAVTLTPPLGGLKGHWLQLWGTPRPHMTAPWCLCPSGLQGGLTSHPAAVPRCSRPACRAVPAAPAGQGSHMRPPRVTWASRAGQPEAAC